MNTLFNTSTSPLDSCQKSSPLLQNNSYRIIHITRKLNEDSDNEDTTIKNSEDLSKNDSHKSRKNSKKSFRLSTRNSFNNWRRKSSRKKRSSAHSKDSERIINLPSSSSPNNLNTSSCQSIKNADSTWSHSSNKMKNSHSKDDSGRFDDSDCLTDVLDEMMNHDDLALHDLLARADQLETNVKKQEFSKVQPNVRTSFLQHRKYYIIALLTIILLAIIVTMIVISIVFFMKDRKSKIDQ